MIQKRLAAILLRPAKSEWANGWIFESESLSQVRINLYHVLRTFKNESVGYLAASSLTTSFICWHGSAQGAQKLSKVTLFRSALMTDVKCSGESIVMRFVGADMVDSGGVKSESVQSFSIQMSQFLLHSPGCTLTGVGRPSLRVCSFGSDVCTAYPMKHDTGGLDMLQLKLIPRNNHMAT